MAAHTAEIGYSDPMATASDDSSSIMAQQALAEILMIWGEHMEDIPEQAIRCVTWGIMQLTTVNRAIYDAGTLCNLCIVRYSSGPRTWQTSHIREIWEAGTWDWRTVAHQNSSDRDARELQNH